MIPNVLFNNGSRTKDLRVDILEGTINDHTVIQIDGAQYQKHNAKRGGSIYQCDKCCFSSDPTNEFGGSLSKYCSPTHNCWEGADIETIEKMPMVFFLLCAIVRLSILSTGLRSLLVLLIVLM